MVVVQTRRTVLERLQGFFYAIFQTLQILVFSLGMTNPSTSYSKEEIQDKMTREFRLRRAKPSEEAHEDSKYSHRKIHGKTDQKESSCTLGGG